MKNPPEIWDTRYADDAHNARVTPDPWLERWPEFFRGKKLKVLDIGCGLGFDTETLLAWGHEVTAIDISAQALALSRRRNPAARHVLMDVRDILFATAPQFDAVVANLSLHYFTQNETKKIFRALFSLLQPEGVLVFRVNAADDLAYGATAAAGEGWECVTVGGVAKQFFSAEKITTSLEGVATEREVRKITTDRFGKPKSLFEVVACKQPQAEPDGARRAEYERHTGPGSDPFASLPRLLVQK